MQVPLDFLRMMTRIVLVVGHGRFSCFRKNVQMLAVVPANKWRLVHFLTPKRC